MAKKGPCWEGYEMIGMKSKGGRKVPNCVKKASKGSHVTEAYQGKFIQVEMDGQSYSNPSLVDYYGDLVDE